MNGYGGSVLRVDLTAGTVHRHPTEEDLARAFLGGRGLNVKRRNVSSIVRHLWLEFRAHSLAPWAVGSVDSRRARLPTLPTAPTTAMVC